MVNPFMLRSKTQIDFLGQALFVEKQSPVVRNRVKLLTLPQLTVKKKLPDESAEFGQWLRSERKARAISQEELGRRVGRSKQHISALERAAPHPSTGKPAKVTPEGVKALAGALNIPIEVALREAGIIPASQNGEDARRLRLVAYFDGLSTEEKDHALALLESIYKHRTKAAHS
jgi:transcriptional regulator with XRE-family HTH domain